MTDLEISKALALAIGWDESRVRIVGVECYVVTDNTIDRFKPQVGWPWWVGGRPFDYRDWNVAGPIAEKLIVELIKCETKGIGYWQAIHGMEGDISHCVANADTPQKAVALAVIGAAK